ncbi:hypothetical protein SAMN05892883_2443 [Jatrophihabitans sp. GAS493]|uniref:DUF6912 family protein n=1 Tax=Jatrophihabitans sp. GAS493 TaxID=1907575 RepID=UPI000BB7D205|nr:hypothetical protein [Jatrophihabitans sp. GAS493]SOD73154.1 hypothetical protein SAMN05892883_2443 [Jatrophihabitans sp. GAS493]
MRIYIPSTMSQLGALLETGELGFGSTTAFAVTDGLRDWYRDDDIEELEYAAMIEAARASLRLLDTEPDTVARRVVLAADVEDGDVSVRDDLDRGVVRVGISIPLSAVVSVHVDGEDAETAVRAAATAMVRAELGDEDAQETVDDVEGYELAWYANQEIPALVELL